MTDNSYRALVVDDEPGVRNLTIRSLTREGFICDGAADGLQAEQLCRTRLYDVVVTDLRMPNQHGHALACRLLASHNHPAVFVLTGVTEPKLAQDLIARGVEGVEFKPIDYNTFGAKMKAIAKKRTEGKSRDGLQEGNGPVPVREVLDGGNAQPEARRHRCASDLDEKILRLSKVLPISQAAYEVYEMARCDSPTQRIAAAIARDASFSAEVLRLANSSFYNRAGSKVVTLEEAVVRLGLRRIGDLAIASGALSVLTANVLPWMNVDLAWKRSVTAGVAADALLARGRYPGADEGLFLTAVMHPLGRIALGMLYPHQCADMARQCAQECSTLASWEERVFGIGYGEVANRLLKGWNIPATVRKPLQYLTTPYFSLAKLSEPLRTKAELLKLAVLISRIVTGQWEPWDELELPSATVLTRLGLDSLPEVLAEAKADSQEILAFRANGSPPIEHVGNASQQRAPDREIAYCNLSPEPFDFLAGIITSLGIGLRIGGDDVLNTNEKAIVNCLWTPTCKLAARIDPRFDTRTCLIIADADHPPQYTRYGTPFTLPASVKALELACRSLM